MAEALHVWVDVDVLPCARIQSGLLQWSDGRGLFVAEASHVWLDVGFLTDQCIHAGLL